MESESNDAVNHAKITNDVLKKYPHLVENNKNIKLEILQKGNSPVIVSAIAKDPTTISTSKNQSAAKQSKSVIVQAKTPVKSDFTSSKTRNTISASAAAAVALPAKLAVPSDQPKKIDDGTMHALIAEGAENMIGPLCKYKEEDLQGTANVLVATTTKNISLELSSEAKAMSYVASGIASSLAVQLEGERFEKDVQLQYIEPAMTNVHGENSKGDHEEVVTRFITEESSELQLTPQRKVHSLEQLQGLEGQLSDNFMVLGASFKHGGNESEVNNASTDGMDHQSVEKEIINEQRDNSTEDKMTLSIGDLCFNEDSLQQAEAVNIQEYEVLTMIEEKISDEKVKPLMALDIQIKESVNTVQQAVQPARNLDSEISTSFDPTKKASDLLIIQLMEQLKQKEKQSARNKLESTLKAKISAKTRAKIIRKSTVKSNKRKLSTAENTHITKKSKKIEPRIEREEFGNLKMEKLLHYKIPTSFLEIEEKTDTTFLSVVKQNMRNSAFDAEQYFYGYRGLLYLNQVAESCYLRDFNQKHIRLAYSSSGRIFKITNSVS